VYSGKVNHSHGNQAVCMVHRTAIHMAGRVYSISEKRYRHASVLPVEFYHRPGFPFQIVFQDPTKSRPEPSERHLDQSRVESVPDHHETCYNVVAMRCYVVQFIVV